MLRIRLARVGKKKQPSYRVVVADIEKKRDGRIVERIGHYNPLAGSGEFDINESRALYWLSVGAQPSGAVRQLLDRQGTLKRLRRLREGESLETLIAEHEGTGVESADEQVLAEARRAVATTAVAVAAEEE